MLADDKLDLSGLTLEPPSLPPVVWDNCPSPTLFWNCDEWFTKIIANRVVVFDAMTYTASVLMTGQCRRLICAKMQGNCFHPRLEVRMAANMHTKLYLVKGKKVDEVWIGSCNLVSSKRWHNIMMLVEGENAKWLKAYFNSCWKEINAR